MRKLTIILTSLLLVVGLGSCKKDNPVKGGDNNGGNNNNGTVTVEQNELPLLKFNGTFNSKAAVTDAEIIAHEEEIGRKLEDIDLGADEDGNALMAKGFVNTDLTITGVIYLPKPEKGRKTLIFAFSKETVENCPNTLAMLKKSGFSKIEDKKFSDGTPYKFGVKDDNAKIRVMLAEESISALESEMSIQFIYAEDLKTTHDLIPDVKDFPSFKVFETGDVDKIKEFEAQLGFRMYSESENPDEEKANLAKKNLLFVTPDANLPKTNILGSFYVTTPTGGDPFINNVVNGLKNEADFADPKVKEWFTTNGYGKEFTADGINGFAYGYDETGEVFCQIFLKDTSVGLQIWREKKGASSSNLMRLDIPENRALKVSDYSIQKLLK